MNLVTVKEGIEVYIGNASVLAAINLMESKEVITMAGNVVLIAGTSVFTYFKIMKMREERLKARAERIHAERDAGIEQTPD